MELEEVLGLEESRERWCSCGHEGITTGNHPYTNPLFLGSENLDKVHRMDDGILEDVSAGRWVGRL